MRTLDALSSNPGSRRGPPFAGFGIMAAPRRKPRPTAATTFVKYLSGEMSSRAVSGPTLTAAERPQTFTLDALRKLSAEKKNLR